MGRIVTALAVAALLAGCEAMDVQDVQQVPLPIDETVSNPNSCVLMHEVVDVTADPATGAPIFNDGSKLVHVKWPKGFTAWRSGGQTQVTDPTGNVVLTTGARYSICPATLDGWTVGFVRPCPACKLGFDLD
jgi:hypothetical protein